MADEKLCIPDDAEVRDIVQMLVTEQLPEGGRSGLVMDFVLVAAVRRMDDDGGLETAVVIVPDGANYAIAGLLDEARRQCNAAYDSTLRGE